MATYSWPSRVYDFSPDQTSSDTSIIYNPTTSWEIGVDFASILLDISGPAGYFEITVYDTNADSIGYLSFNPDESFDTTLTIPVTMGSYDIDYVELYNDDLVSVTSKAISATLGRVVSLDAAVQENKTAAIGLSGAISKFPYNQIGSDLTNFGTSGAADYDMFGAGVALSRDGLVLAVGSPGYTDFYSDCGGVYTYDKSGTSWSLRSATLVLGGNTSNNLGSAVALSSDGDYLAVGSPGYSTGGTNRGSVQVYSVSGSVWATRGNEIGGIAAGDKAGTSVALSGDGSLLAYGSPYRSKSGGPSTCGSVRIYTWGGADYGSAVELYAPDAANSDGFGRAVSLTTDGETLVVGATDDPAYTTGKVYTFDWSGSAWVQRGSTLTNPDSTIYKQFGFALSVSGDGEKLFIQAKLSGYTRIVTFLYSKSGTSWVFSRLLEHPSGAMGGMWSAGSEYLGECDVAADETGTMLALGSADVNVSTGTGNGSVYTLMSDTRTIYLSGAVMATYTTTTSLNALIAENVEDVSDNSTASDTPVPGVTTSGALTDSGAGVAEALEVAHIFRSLSESAAGVSTAADSQLTFLLDAVAAAETQALQMSGSWAYGDISAAGDTLVSVYQNFISEAAAGSVSTAAVLAVLLDSLLQSVDAMATQGSFIHTLAQLAASVDALEQGLLEGLSDSATASTTLRYSAYLTAMDQASGVDTASSFILVTEPVVDSGVVAETLSLVQALNYAWADIVNIYVRLSISGEVVTGWVLNTQTSAASEYQGFSFNSMAKIAGKYYGASDTGVYEMSGDTDAGTTIATYIKTGLLDFPDASGKTPHDAQKRISHLYLVCDASGAVAIKAVSVERGVVTENFYSVTMSPDATENTRVLMGKGARGRYWMLEIGSEALETFDAVSIYPIYLSRRI